MDSLKSTTDLDTRIELHLLTEEDTAHSFESSYDTFNITAVPLNFSPSKAKHKARALEYFRLSTDLGPDDWVLHLDEETMVDEHCLRTCLDFLHRRQDVHMKIAQVSWAD